MVRLVRLYVYFIVGVNKIYRKIGCGCGRKRRIKFYFKICLGFFFGNYKKGLVFCWDSVRKSLIRVSLRESGRKGMVLVSK